MPYGKIYVKWEKVNSKFIIEINLPNDTNCLLKLFNGQEIKIEKNYSKIEIDI